MSVEKKRAQRPRISELPKPGEARILAPTFAQVKQETTMDAHKVATDLFGVLIRVPVDPAAVARELLSLTWADEETP